MPRPKQPFYKPALGQLKKAFDELEQIESCTGDKEEVIDRAHKAVWEAIKWIREHEGDERQPGDA